MYRQCFQRHSRNFTKFHTNFIMKTTKSKSKHVFRTFQAQKTTQSPISLHSHKTHVNKQNFPQVQTADGLWKTTHCGRNKINPGFDSIELTPHKSDGSFRSAGHKSRDGRVYSAINRRGPLLEDVEYRASGQVEDIEYRAFWQMLRSHGLSGTSGQRIIGSVHVRGFDSLLVRAGSFCLAMHFGVDVCFMWSLC